MSLTHATSAKAAATDAVTALLGTNAKLCFQAGGTVGSPGTAICTLLLDSGANGGFSTGGATATAGTISDDTNTGSGTVSTFSLKTSANAAIIFGAVSTSGSDINITSGGLTFSNGDTCQCSSLTYTALTA